MPVLALLLMGASMQFRPPTHDERLSALGSTRGLSQPLRRALTAGDDFEPIPEPGPHDWLANHPEPGQTFDEFVRSQPNRPDGKRSKLYLLPLGEFADGQSPPLERLQRFAAAFFMMDVQVLPALNIKQAGITTRQNQFTGNTQLLTGDILRLLREKLPDDAYALLGITMVDLYPDPSWNFVFGQASLQHRVGVYSFARYDPRFYGDEDTAKRSLSVAPGRDNDTGKQSLTVAPSREQLMLRRSCKVLAHETGHMFGIRHCICFSCLMNGSNHLDESDARPLHLCPVDLRKLHRSVGFDVVERYRRLREFCKGVGFVDEARWLADRLEYLESADQND